MSFRTILSDLKPQFLRIRFTLLIATIVSILALGFVAAFQVFNNVPVSQLVRDTAAVAGVKPWVGALSNVGMLLWAGTAALCLLSGTIVGRGQRFNMLQLFFYWMAFCTAYLLFDDLFQIHEKVSDAWDVPEELFLIAYGLPVVYFLIRLRKLLLKTDYLLMFLALGFFGLSLLFDVFHLEFIYPYTGLLFLGEVSAGFLLEEGAKFIGIVFWFAYFFHVSAWVMQPNPEVLQVGYTEDIPFRPVRVAWRVVTQPIVLATVAIALAVWLPRGFALNHFATVDESRWLIRSANFYQALHSGNLADTFQHGHPGVTVMYAGMAGYLTDFPDYVDHVNEQLVWSDAAMDRLEALGHKPMELMAAGRVFIVLLNVIALTVSFLYARRLVGLWPAFVAFLLIAFDPFHIALSRFLHPDSLLGTMMLLATLAFMNYLFAGRRTIDLVAAGVYTAIAWLTKTPAVFLLPLVGLLSLIELAVHVTGWQGNGESGQRSWQWSDFVSRASLWRLLRTWLIWGGVTALVFVALWPAMWVAPINTLGQVLSISSTYATEGHSSSVFFNGRIYTGDPGLWFYPVNYLWRTTPVVMVGLILLVAAFFWRGSLARRRVVLLTVVGLLASAFFFTIFMTLGAKKFDRYLLPVFPSLDFAAGIGWAALVVGLATLFQRIERTQWQRWGYRLGGTFAVAAIAIQAALSIDTYPYYLSYYNPVMGDKSKAEEVMLLGWGEGLNEAARYLNQITDPATTRVAAWYERGPFSFFYNGPSSSSRYIWETDYAVVYNHQWQRELPSRRMMNYFDTMTPIHTVTIDGIDYVKIYEVSDAPDPDFTVRWGGAIDLRYYDTIPGNLYPGQLFEMTLYLDKSAPLDKNYHIKVRIVNQDGHTFMLKEGRPLYVKTSEWDIGHILRDDTYRTIVPEDTPPGLYRIEVSFYDPDTFDVLPAVQLNNGQLLSEPYVLDYLVIGDWPPSAAVKLDAPVVLGDMVELFGAGMVNANGKEETLTGKSFAPGDAIDLRLHWLVHNFIHNDYTTFVQAIGPDGNIVAQADRRPLDGFVPTSYWSPRQEMVDNYPIQLPEDAPAGEYRLLVGWYDLETMARLPMTQEGSVIGDAYQVATFTVQ